MSRLNADRSRRWFLSSALGTGLRVSELATTNLPFQQWTEVLGSERLTGAVLDRLTHRCHLLEATGPSYRLRDAQRRRKAAPSSEAPATEAAAPRRSANGS